MAKKYKIGVLSDTHMPRMAKALPAELLKGLAHSDYIIHAGDWSDWSVYEALKEIAPVKGVTGNADTARIKEHFGATELFEAGGIRIGIVHGHGTKGTTESRALKAFEGEKVGCIIFGHSHIPLIKHAGQTLLFNPGSPTDKRRQPLYSYGILEIEDGRLEARHVFFRDKRV